MSANPLEQKLFSFVDFQEIYLKKQSTNKPFQSLIALKNEAFERSTERASTIDKLKILVDISQTIYDIDDVDKRQSSDAYMELITKYPEYECWHAQDVNDEIIKLIQKL